MNRLSEHRRPREGLGESGFPADPRRWQIRNIPLRRYVRVPCIAFGALSILAKLGKPQASQADGFGEMFRQWPQRSNVSPEMFIDPYFSRPHAGLQTPASTSKESRQLRNRSSFGEPGALFSMRAGTSSTEGGCSDLDPSRGSGCGAKLTCNRLARLAKMVRFLAPLIAAVRCHSPSSRTTRVHLHLEPASPATQPTSSRHKRSRASSIASLKPAERDTRADVRK